MKSGSAIAFCLVLLTCVALGAKIGYIHAHYTVAMECERLSGFYVGNKVYECQLNQEKSR